MDKNMVAGELVKIAKSLVAESEAVGTPVEDALDGWRNATDEVRRGIGAIRVSNPELYGKLSKWFSKVHELDSQVADFL
jgi:hypothetical protein